MNKKKMRRPTMRFLILVFLCFHLIASSNCFKVVHAIDIKKELVVNKGVVHRFGRHGRGRRSRGLCRGSSKGISRIPAAAVIPVIAFGSGHQTHDPKNNYTGNMTRCTRNSTSVYSNTACIDTGDSVACTSTSTTRSGQSQSVYSILTLVIPVLYDLLTY